MYTTFLITFYGNTRRRKQNKFCKCRNRWRSWYFLGWLKSMTSSAEVYPKERKAGSAGCRCHCEHAQVAPGSAPSPASLGTLCRVSAALAAGGDIWWLMGSDAGLAGADRSLLLSRDPQHGPAADISRLINAQTTQPSAALTAFSRLPKAIYFLLRKWLHLMKQRWTLSRRSPAIPVSAHSAQLAGRSPRAPSRGSGWSR